MSNKHVARARAERLLREVLSEPQRKTLDEHGHFDVFAGGHTYRIHRGRSANVLRLDDGVRFCAHPETDLPDADTMLAQKLMLEADEAGFLAIANLHQPQPSDDTRSFTARLLESEEGRRRLAVAVQYAIRNNRDHAVECISESGEAAMGSRLRLAEDILARGDEPELREEVRLTREMLQ